MKTLLQFKMFLGVFLFLLVSSYGQQNSPNTFSDAVTTGPYICEPDWIEVMFNDNSEVRLRNGELIDFRTDATSGLDEILSSVTWYAWQRISDVPEDVINQWETNGETNTGKDIYNMNNLYHLRIPKGQDIWEISKQIENLQGVILARPMPKPIALPLPIDYQPQQGYENPASNNPSGIDAEYAWTQSGGTGTGITVCDLEYSWNYNHADISKAFGSQINTNVVDPFTNTNHGTAVIGELVADNNGWGTTGICYGSNLKTCGTYYGVSPLWNVPGAMSVAISNLIAGDIILLEQQWDYTGSGAYIPIEWWLNYSPNVQTFNGVYAAIQNAVANGIHVVEAGGNGNINTDNLTWYGNSGGIIVGAGAATSTTDRQRLSFSSYGQRFDLQGWGENVVTTGYGDLYSSQGVNYYYTSVFSGTSSASPIIAGAIACASGYYLANISTTPPSPSFLLSQFKNYSTPQVFPPSGNIGPRPDLLQIIQNFPTITNTDWGDAPDMPYPTLSTNNGANHTISSNMYLGTTIDGEANGQPSFNALGDDLNNTDDEDGVLFVSPLTPGSTANVNVIASTNGFLNAWIDFNKNGNWGDSGEWIFMGQPLTPGVNNLTFSIPATAFQGITYARFRFSSITVLLFYGPAPNGEVEDYTVFIEESMQNDWGDAMDQPYPTLSANGGANHKILPGFFLGNLIDAEADGLPDPLAMGDDNNNTDDEDGIVFNGPLIPGQNVVISITSSQPGFVNGWIDFFGNGNWSDPVDQILFDLPVIAGTNVANILIPPGSLFGPTYSRFRLTTYAGVGFAGPASDGEVEDYHVMIEQNQQIDWGDAPDSPYPTLSVNTGANHMIVPGFMLGNQIDGEPDGQPNPNASGDDLNNIQDEDGVSFAGPIIPGQAFSINVIASTQGLLNAWIDFQQNGNWIDPGEQIAVDMNLNPGMNTFSILAPAGIPSGQTFARFRFSSVAGLSFQGNAPDGEVEDYQIFIGEEQQYDWGDAPDNPYPTLSINNGANHVIIPGFYLGNQIDGEPDGQPDSNATGDDNNNLQDEDGVTFAGPVKPGQSFSINVVASTQGILNAWIDYMQNGNWIDPGEQIAVDMILMPGTNTFILMAPPGISAGQTFARFRFSSMAGLSFQGPAPDGEVEDYQISIQADDQFDWGDAPDIPYPTLSANSGANHKIVPGMMLGNLIDAEQDGLPDPLALGDNNNNLQDEDGVVFQGNLIVGQPANITVIASAPGLLNTWIDFNLNGTWADPGEQIFIDILLNPGSTTLTFVVPPNAIAGMSFSRFRFSSLPGLSFTGPAPDGEVEDYQVTIDPIAYKWLQLPDLTPLGMDVEASNLPMFPPPLVLADDYLCNITGPLNTITIWGSWFQDILPNGDPNAVQFTLSIHEDIPASQSPTGYSMPGNLIWMKIFNPGEFIAALYASNLTEGWFNPALPYYTPFGDTQCWMYKFNINGQFIQTGTSDIPKVYWIDLQAAPLTPDPNCRFGWKSSESHWNDDGVYGIGIEPYSGPWWELRYPQGHPLFDQSVDLAFMVEGTEDPFILVDLKIFLEGPFNNGLMNTSLNSAGLLPNSQPYTLIPAATWYYNGAEVVTTIPNSNVVDWIEIELRETPGGASTATLPTRIAQKASFLLNNGSIVATDGISIPKFYHTVTQNLYAVIWHRNHLGIMSAIPLTSGGGNLYTYDFTPSSSTVYGGNLGYKLLGLNTWGLYAADGDGDEQITNADKNNVWRSQSGMSGYLQGDFNMDSQVGNVDKAFYWKPNAGKGSQVP